MMTRRERLMATLWGQPVDRPAVSFYEVGGFIVDPADPDPFNIYNDPSWQPLLRLAEEETDLMRLCVPLVTTKNPLVTTERFMRDGSRFTRTIWRTPERTLTQLARRDPGTNTAWIVEHLLKDMDDLEAFLQLPDEIFCEDVRVDNLLAEEEKLGDRGIVVVDTADPLCMAASLFSMEDYTVAAFTEPALFQRLLHKMALPLHRRTEFVAREFPGRLWRIHGPEYASEPYLPNHLFEEYVVRHTGPMVRTIKQHGGFARIHCHGRIRHLLRHFVAMGADATDPIEPPPQGDISLAEVHRNHGRELVLFGNLEAADLENMPPREFEALVKQALREGTAGDGRGFVLLPSASPYGRTITPVALANYETMVRLARSW